MEENGSTKKEPTVNVDHLVKQRKRKDLSNEYIYGSIDGVVEMFPLGVFTLGRHGGKTLNVVIQELKEENEKLTKRLDKNKEVTKALLERIQNLEKGFKDYGLN